MLRFYICRYNSEEVFINCGHYLHWNSICCIVWTYPYYELHLRNLHCVYLDASGYILMLLSILSGMLSFLTWTYVKLQFFSSFHLLQRSGMSLKTPTWKWIIRKTTGAFFFQVLSFMKAKLIYTRLWLPCDVFSGQAFRCLSLDPPFRLFWIKYLTFLGVADVKDCLDFQSMEGYWTRTK